MRGNRIILLLFLIVIVVIVTNLNGILRIYYPMNYSDYVYKYAAQYKLDPYFVEAVIKSESNFDANAKSKKNAYGLMQITPTTAEWAAEKMGIKAFSSDMLYNPEFNIRMGCWYLNDLSSEFKGNMDLVLAAYNGGRGNVKKWLNDTAHSSDGQNLDYIPFKETDKYVKKVNTNYSMYKKLYKRP
ncbi:MAG: lytic transglycosylase domain-containing protein [Bacillota bacterium]|nr:lytic transglycosylase domain-containing protein [Bacillota bacterium]